MSTYKNSPRPNVASANSEAEEAGASQEKPIPVDGFNQVLEMLQVADPEFRESLLRRLAIRDRGMAKRLREDLGI